MKIRLACVVLAGFVFGAASVPNAFAELAKSGTYTGNFGWLTVGTNHTIYEGRVLFTGQFSGTFFNDADEGFMHKAAVLCPGAYDFDFNNKVGKAQGFCMLTDADGDTAQLQWDCQGDTVECSGPFTWIRGTGKYQGISGTNKFQALIVGISEHGNASGYSSWQGEWKLP